MEIARPWPRQVKFIERVLIDAHEDDGRLWGNGAAKLEPQVQAFELQIVQPTPLVNQKREGGQGHPDNEGQEISLIHKCARRQ